MSRYTTIRNIEVSRFCSWIKSRTTFKKARHFSIILASGLSLSACLTIETERTRSLFFPTASNSQTSFNGDTIQGLSPEERQIIRKYGGIYSHPPLQRLMSDMLPRLQAASEKPELSYRIIVLDTPRVNAFALPDGKLFITRGLVALANDGSELAAIIAHEMAHVIASHAVIRENEAKRAVFLSRVMNDVLGNTSEARRALLQSKLDLAQFSQAQELEADSIGIGIIARAGYDAFAAARILESLEHWQQFKGTEATLDYFSSHPTTGKRRINARRNARVYRADNAQTLQQEFLTSLDGIAFGDNPAQGIIDENRFIHPRLGFAFLAPNGFSLEATPDIVIGANDDADRALRFDIVHEPSGIDLSDYLASQWLQNIDPASIQAISINGYRAATATASGENWDFKLCVIRKGSDIYRFVFAAQNMTQTVSTAFDKTAASLRFLSQQEKQNYRPQSLRIINSAQNADQLATALSNSQTQQLLLNLNGARSLDALRRQPFVKIIISE